MEKLKVVIVGHVDHGKSTLIGRILYDTKSILQDKMSEVETISKEKGTSVNFAYFTDHLLEEREQNITIDTTQTFFKTKCREYVIIDAPGHKEFTTNMITGASQADIAILIVDALEGCQEQTKRHAYIISMLGLKKVILAVNKMDAIDFEQTIYEKVRKECEDYLGKVNIHNVYSIPISALQGDNVAVVSDQMPWYKGKAVLEALDTLFDVRKSNKDESIFSIQDLYDLDNKKISVGKVECGNFRINDEVIVMPAMRKTVIASIEKYMEEVSFVSIYENAGFVLKDSITLNKGDVIASPINSLKRAKRLQVQLFWMGHKGVEEGDKLQFQCSTQQVYCTIVKIGRALDETISMSEKKEGEMNYLDIREVFIQTDKEVIVSLFQEQESFGRFVLVKDNDICGWGTIVQFS